MKGRRPQITFANCKFFGDGLGPAVHSRGDLSLEFINPEFHNVTKAFDVKGANSMHVSGARIKHDPKLKLAANRSSGDTSRSLVGWRRAEGPALPSFCPECGSVFASSNYDMAGQYFNLWDNEDTCIACGYEHAKLSQGHFDLTGETVRILRAPDITQEMVDRLTALGRDVLHGKLRPNEVVAPAEKLHPSFGRLMRKWAGWGAAAFTLFTIVTSTISTNWDLADRMGWTDADLATQRVVERALEAHERLWEKRHSTNRSIFDNVPDKNRREPSAAPTDGKAENPNDHRAHVNRKKREELQKRRGEWGKSRSR